MSRDEKNTINYACLYGIITIVLSVATNIREEHGERERDRRATGGY